MTDIAAIERCSNQITTPRASVPLRGEVFLDMKELLARAADLADGLVSPDEGMTLIDAAIELTASADQGMPWRRRQIAYAITMAGWGLWRSVGETLAEAFRERGEDGDVFTGVASVAELRELRAAMAQSPPE